MGVFWFIWISLDIMIFEQFFDGVIGVILYLHFLVMNSSKLCL